MTVRICYGMFELILFLYFFRDPIISKYFHSYNTHFYVSGEFTIQIKHLWREETVSLYVKYKRK